jgi:NAD+ synthase
MEEQKVIDHIVNWLNNYCESTHHNGFIVGISGGIDSALTSKLCALTGKKVIALSLPLRQRTNEYKRALNHISFLTENHNNVLSHDIDLTDTFNLLEKTLPHYVIENKLAMANTRSRLRMSTLYAVGQANNLLVTGTGNKIEDFGVGFFTKYGDGGVDISPIADLTKTEVKKLAKYLSIDNEILSADPTDGLWDEDDRTDEKQMGASYIELEWAMEYSGNKNELSERQIEVLNIYQNLHEKNKHKIDPIPVCLIPK